MLAKLEVGEVHDSRRGRVCGHRGGVVGVAAEGLVAQHRTTGVDSARDMLPMQERRPVDGNQVDV